MNSAIGVLLINLGTPDAPTPAAVRRYLNQFLSDRRVVEIPPVVWQPILKAVILTTRPAKSAHAYREIWTDAGSPLAAITRRQADALAPMLGSRITVDWAMRYGNPSIESRLEALRAAGCDRILIAPLYPQYCAATTATANDAVFAALGRMRWQPAIRTVPPWYADPGYIDALKTSVDQALGALDFAPDLILASFHGMPERTRALGDPYHDQCVETARRLTDALGRDIEIAFQSRFGRAKWLEPATDQLLATLPGRGVTRVAVICPGFVADCLETLEEIAIRGRDTFHAAGGEKFAYLPCLNDSPESLFLLCRLMSRELEGWIGPF